MAVDCVVPIRPGLQKSRRPVRERLWLFGSFLDLAELLTQEPPACECGGAAPQHFAPDLSRMGAAEYLSGGKVSIDASCIEHQIVRPDRAEYSLAGNRSGLFT